jgi:hypothetical protein
LLFFTGIAREKLFSFYPENTYLFVCSVTVHGVTIKIATPQTFSIKIVLTKRSSEKYTTDMKFIYYTNCTYLFTFVLSSAHVMIQEISKGRSYFSFK